VSEHLAAYIERLERVLDDYRGLIKRADAIVDRSGEVGGSCTCSPTQCSACDALESAIREYVSERARTGLK